MTASIFPGVAIAATAIIVLLANKQARVHASKKFTWLRWLGDDSSEETPMELVIEIPVAVEEASNEETPSEEAAAVEETTVGETTGDETAGQDSAGEETAREETAGEETAAKETAVVAFEGVEDIEEEYGLEIIRVYTDSV